MHYDKQWYLFYDKIELQASTTRVLKMNHQKIICKRCEYNDYDMYFSFFSDKYYCIINYVFLSSFLFYIFFCYSYLISLPSVKNFFKHPKDLWTLQCQTIMNEVWIFASPLFFIINTFPYQYIQCFTHSSTNDKINCFQNYLFEIK